MASEDSVENLTLRYPPVLAVPVDGVGKPDQAYEALTRAMSPVTDELDSSRDVEEYDLEASVTRRR